jgi:hypothetical protein
MQSGKNWVKVASSPAEAKLESCRKTHRKARAQNRTMINDHLRKMAVNSCLNFSASSSIVVTVLRLWSVIFGFREKPNIIRFRRYQTGKVGDLE